VAVEITMVKGVTGQFQPATSADIEAAALIKSGQAKKFTAVSVSKRALANHHRYFAMLNLALDYWEPKGGFISANERSVLLDFSRWLDKHGGKTGALNNACKVFLDELAENRSKTVESPSKSINALHNFVKIEAGFFGWERTPKGLVQRVRSINFNSLDEEGFKAYYKQSFEVLWRFILSRHFKAEGEAMAAAERMLEFS